MKVGFIGLGTMGGAMAANLASAGFRLIVHDRDREKAEPLKALGASWADTPRACAEGADTIVTSLPGPPEVRAVAVGESGVLAGLSKGAVWIDMTTNSPALVRELGAAAEARGASVLDAPVTGAVDGARTATLTIFVGGDTNVFKAHRSLFRALGRKVVHTGLLGSGNVVKLVTNLLWFIHAAAIGEGLVLGVRGGVDPLVLWTSIKASAGSSFVAEHDVPSIFAGHYDPSFTLDLCVKDLGLIRALGREVGVPLELTRLAAELFARAHARYGGAAGEMSVVRLLEEATETALRVPGDWPPPWERGRGKRV